MQPTQLTILTPPGSGAIAVLELAGPGAWAIARTHLRPAGLPLPDSIVAGLTAFGRVGPGAGDEVVLAVPRDGVVEIHCHGGVQVVRMLTQLFLDAGCVMAVEQPTATFAEAATRLLLHAKTLRTASILLDQVNGALDRAMNDPSQHERIGRFESLGKHLIEPWKITVVGAPNAGKSSLLNALAGYQRSVVSPTPGTTRDVVTVTLAFDGWLFELSDTAGLREGSDELESAGIERAKRQMSDADLILWVIDATADVPPCPANGIVVPVFNKIDLLPDNWEQPINGVPVSATRGDGIALLISQIVQKLVPEVPAPGEAVPLPTVE